MASKHIPPDMREFVDGLVASGRYLHESDVVREGLELLKDQEYAMERRRAELYAKIEEGIASADRGDLIDAEEVFEELRTMLEQPPAGSQDAA
jgi:antitoxin ParD1/3/4